MVMPPGDVLGQTRSALSRPTTRPVGDGSRAGGLGRTHPRTSDGHRRTDRSARLASRTAPGAHPEVGGYGRGATEWTGRRELRSRCERVTSHPPHSTSQHRTRLASRCEVAWERTTRVSWSAPATASSSPRLTKTVCSKAVCSRPASGSATPTRCDRTGRQERMWSNRGTRQALVGNRAVTRMHQLGLSPQNWGDQPRRSG
jgi:hypothetical protein